MLEILALAIISIAVLFLGIVSLAAILVFTGTISGIELDEEDEK